MYGVTPLNYSDLERCLRVTNAQPPIATIKFHVDQLSADPSRLTVAPASGLRFCRVRRARFSSTKAPHGNELFADFHLTRSGLASIFIGFVPSGE